MYSGIFMRLQLRAYVINDHMQGFQALNTFFSGGWLVKGLQCPTYSLLINMAELSLSNCWEPLCSDPGHTFHTCSVLQWEGY